MNNNPENRQSCCEPELEMNKDDRCDDCPGHPAEGYVPPKAASLSEIADLLAGMQRIPHYTLKCHPSVKTALLEAQGYSVQTTTPDGLMMLNPPLLSMEIFEDPDMAPGEWVIKADGVTVQSGVLTA